MSCKNHKKRQTGLTSGLEAFLTTEKGTLDSKSVKICKNGMGPGGEWMLTCDKWDTRDGREDCH